MEGRGLASCFTDLLERLLARGVRFVTLAEAAQQFGHDAGNSPLAMGELPGRAGEVAIQGHA